MAFPAPEQVRDWIAESFPCETLKVTGDGQHFEALIVSERFAGLGRVARHKLVYRALGERMRGDIHALSMRAMTPEEFGGQD